MTWLLAIAGIFFIGNAGFISEYLVGGLIGYILAATIINRRKLDALEKKLSSLENRQLLNTPPKVDSVSQKIGVDPVVVQKAVAKPNYSYRDDEPEPAQKLESEKNSDEISSQNNWSKDLPASALNTAIESAVSFIKSYFLEGNIIVSIGTVVLFFGVSFFIKYSIDNALVPLEFRLIALSIGSIIMLLVGWRLRVKKSGYALIMQGGAIAILYLTIFASFKLYNLTSASFTFPLLIIFSALAMFLAVVQNSKALAVTAIAGGFASPILASTGSGNYIALFSYYLILNLAIFGVSWFKSWRILNLVGFAFTFIISVMWGATNYKAEFFTTTEPFLVSYFLIYVCVSVLFAIKQKPHLKGYVDGTLVFGLPVVAFGLQAALVHNIEYGLAWSSFALGFFYLGLAKLLWNNTNSNFRLLTEAFLALGVIFATLIIPFALDGRWTAASWAIEGAGFVWIGLRQHRSFVKVFGMLVQVIGSFLFIVDYPYAYDSILFLNSEFLGAGIVSMAALATAILLSQKQDNRKNILALLFLFWSLVWWYGSGVLQIEKHLHASYEIAAYVSFFVMSAWLWFVINYKYQRRIFNFYPWLLIIPLWGYFLLSIIQNHAFAHFGYIAWPIALLSSFGIYYLCEKFKYSLVFEEHLYTAAYLLLTALIGMECFWYIKNALLATAWSVSVLALVMTIALAVIERFNVWPFNKHADSYQFRTSLILMFGLLVWTIFGNFAEYLTPRPLAYISILNPIDIVQGFALLVSYQWYKSHQETNYIATNKTIIVGFLAILCFVWFNVILLKTIHTVTDVTYRAEALFDSAIVQMAISISWTIIGLVVMVLASNKHHRILWMSGATLACIVVAKLFMLDLAGRGTVERIITFMIVGILLLVVGYFSPVPPAQKIKEEQLEETNESDAN